MNTTCTLGVLATAMAATLWTTPAAAVTPADLPPSTEDSFLYYEIGGGRAVSPFIDRKTAIIHASPSLRSRYACGAFDLDTNLENILNDFKRGLDNAANTMVFAAQSAIASLPAYVLQRVNPGLYELFQNALLRAEEQVQLAVKTCEQAEAEIAQGKNPYQDWVVLARGETWGRQAEAGATATDARQSVYTTGGDDGVPWVAGKRAGGRGQDGIRVLGDTTVAGYNLLLGRSADTTGAPAQGATSPRFVETFPNPDAARAWVNEVLGELVINTAQDSVPQQQPGAGLTLKVHETALDVREKLALIAAGGNAPDAEAIAAVSAPDLFITPALIHALRELPAAQRSAAVDRLASEVAVARTVDAALAARRLLLAGRREPHVAGTPAVSEIDRTLAELNREIDDIVSQQQIRQQLVSHTAKALLEQQQIADTQPKIPLIPRDTRPLENGAVKDGER